MAVRGRLACVLYRLSNRLHNWRIPLVPALVFHVNAIVNGCEVHYAARIGRDMDIGIAATRSRAGFFWFICVPAASDNSKEGGASPRVYPYAERPGSPLVR